MKHRTKKVISYIVTLLVIAAAALWVCMGGKTKRAILNEVKVRGSFTITMS